MALHLKEKPTTAIASMITEITIPVSRRAILVSRLAMSTCNSEILDARPSILVSILDASFPTQLENLRDYGCVEIFQEKRSRRTAARLALTGLYRPGTTRPLGGTSSAIPAIISR